MSAIEKDFSFKDLFLPVTTVKAIHILVITGLLAFFNGFFNGFVSDDNTIVLNNPLVHSLSNLPRIFFENKYDASGPSFLGGSYFRPVTDSWFTIHYHLFGPNAFPFHFSQIMLYIINAILLFFLLKNFFSKTFVLFLSLIFLLHPVNSENAFYIASVQEVLYFFFGITALLVFIRGHSSKYLSAVGFLLLLSLLSKETGLLFIVAISVYTLLYKRALLKSVLTLNVTVLVVYGLMRLVVLGSPLNLAAHSPMERLSVYERIINIPSILLFYVKQLIIPFELATSYQWIVNRVDIQHFYIPLFLVAIFFGTLVAVGGAVRKHYDQKYFKKYLFFALWFCLGLTLHLQIYPLDQTVADRWLYFSVIGFFCLIAVLLELFKLKKIHTYLLSFLVVLLMLFSIKDVMRSFDFRNDYTLVMSDMRASKDSFSLEYILSGVYLQQGNFRDAKNHGERSVKLFPTTANYNNLGVIYLNLNNYSQAKQAFLSALTYGEDFLPYENLSTVALVYGDAKENRDFIKKKAVKKYPMCGNCWFSLAVLEYKLGNHDEALNAILLAQKYVNAPHVQGVKNIIEENKPLYIKNNNGQVSFETLN